ncbi:uncharacterized protein [Physcomitrium patens]|uniref:Uncharacterized protein n=1 Tax=Physcomitrium patens TaxID=3218 RepID=A0A2K1JVN6_PHYPA|nr:DNA-binding protein BIN4-like [Physcomitrium patens]PNR45587.1 hypothetical protein PHYPA_015358 [Physcomitrium patens]|eukprot:XP_024388665.1 DNA-binding protein BIN4-like [Physcomitrella patens]
MSSVVEIDGVEFEVKVKEPRKGPKSKLAKKKEAGIASIGDEDEDVKSSSLVSTKSKRKLSGNGGSGEEEEKVTPSSRKRGKISMQESKIESDHLDADGLSARDELGFEVRAAEADDEGEVIKGEETWNREIIASQDDVLLTQFSSVQTQEVDEGDALETQEQERRIKPRAASSLPIVFGEKVNKTKVLLECEGDALDLSGDMGAVGRFTVNRRDNELLLDLKGVIYKTTIVPSNTFFLVNVGQTDAKVESIMSDFVQLRADTIGKENETVVEGTLQDFTFESDEEGERPPVDGGDLPASAEEVKHEEEGADDGKQAKRKKPSAKATNGGKVPVKKALTVKSKVGRGKASAKGGVGKKPTAKKATKAGTGKK